MADKSYFKKNKLIFLILLILFLHLIPLIHTSNNTIDSNKKSDKNPNKPISFIHTSASSPPNAAYFGYYKNITVDHTKVNGSGSHEDFPMLISIYDPDLYSNTQSNGSDIAFSNGADWLDHEIELFNQNYNDTHAHLVAWVRISLLFTSTNTSIYMYYGNSTMGPRQNPEGVWDSNYKGVWHLEETPSNGGTHYDSTSNDNDGIWNDNDGNGNTNATGKIDGANDFDGFDDFVNISDDQSLYIRNELTISFWSYARSQTGTQMVVGNGGGWSGEGYHVMSYQGRYRFEIQSSFGQDISDSSVFSINKWYYIVAVYNGSDQKFYINGSSDTTESATLNEIGDSPANLGIGYGIYDVINSDHFDGIIEEVRISNKSRSADWITTEYNNQHDPDSFYSIGNFTDQRPPTWGEQPSDQENEVGVPFSYDVNAFDVSGIDHYEINDTDNFSVDVEGLITNATILSIGVYLLKIGAYDPFNNFCEQNITVIVVNTTNPIWDTTPTNQTILFGAPFSYDVNASDISGIDHYWINDTYNFQIDENGLITNAISLSFGVYPITIRAYDPSNNYCEQNITVTAQDIFPPEQPVITSAPTGEVSGTLIFDWMDGFDQVGGSGIAQYRLIISTNNDPNNATGYVLDVYINNTGPDSSYYELNNTLALGKYYYFISQIDGVDLQSSYTVGTFTVISIDKGINELMFPIIIGIIFASVIGSITTIVIVRRRIQKDSLPRRKKIPLKIILTHIDNISDSSQSSEKIAIQKVKKQKVSNKVIPQKEVIDEKELEKQVNKYKTLGEELFAEGAYLEAQKQFEGAEKLLLTLGRKEEALLFSELSIGIMGLIEEHEKRLESLEQAKLEGNSINIFDLYYEIIGISTKFKDLDAVNMYQSELIQLFQDDKLKLKDLESQRFNLYKQANSQFNDNLFEKAAENFEKCKKISQFLVQIGRENEKNNVEKFREKIKDCLNKA